jgi:hypothetical protein
VRYSIALGEIDGLWSGGRQSCENNLRRLNTEYIDIYFQHRVDTDTPIEDTVGEMARLVEEGKVQTALHGRQSAVQSGSSQSIGYQCTMAQVSPRWIMRFKLTMSAARATANRI